MRSQRIGFLIIGLWLIAAPTWAQFRQPDQRPFRSSGGTTAGYINTPTVSSGAVTVLTRCRSAGCTDWDRIANGTNAGSLTITLPTAGLMADAEYLYVQVNDTGTAPSSISFTAPSGVTLKSLVLGDTGQTLSATVCGTPPATGSVWYRFNWSAVLGNLTAEGCGPNAPSAALAVALGGTGLTTLTAHTVQVGEGTSTPAQVAPPATVGYVLTGNNATTDPSFLARPVAPDFFFGGTVANSTVVSYQCPSNMNLSFPAGLASSSWPDGNSVVNCGSAPSGSASDYIIAVNGTQKADVSLAASTCAPTFTAAAPFTCTTGQTLTVTAPGTTHSEANVSIVLSGHSPP